MSLPVAELRRIDLFDDLDDAALEAFAAVAEPFDAAPGEVLTQPGEPPAGVQLLLEGVVRMLAVSPEGRLEPSGRQHAPTWMNAISVIGGGTPSVQAQAETACRIARIPAEDFRRLAFAHEVVHTRVVRQIGPVMTKVAAREQNRERLASLGTMAAGLAHELNNPAAAASRAAAQLAEALDTVSGALGRFVDAGVERAEAAQILALHQQVLDAASGRTPLDALDAADAEDELLDTLEALGVPEPWRMVEPLAAAGVDQAWLDQVAALAGPATDAAIGWLAATLTARGLAEELQESTRRMSDLVGAVKTYAYMDRGDLVEVDLHEGLETTLKVLGHKLKHSSIAVVRDYDRSLGKLTVHGPELNQVWTNLLDNAIDALGGEGTITITTRRDGGCAEVLISDDGPGIAPEIRERLFDSFTTTKDVGQGTGLGLATARRIVTDRHEGSLTVESEPGRTTFTVRLPLPEPAEQEA